MHLVKVIFKKHYMDLLVSLFNSHTNLNIRILARKLKLSQSTVYHIINKLEKYDLVSTTKQHKKKHTYLTEKGKLVSEQILMFRNSINKL